MNAPPTRRALVPSYLCAFALALSVLLVGTSLAAEPKAELLWPDGAPGAKGDEPNDKRR